MALSVYLVKEEVVHMECKDYLQAYQHEESSLHLLKPISVGDLSLTMGRRGFLSQLQVDSLLESFLKPELANETCMSLSWMSDKEQNGFFGVLDVTGDFIQAVVQQLPPCSLRVKGSFTATILRKGTQKKLPSNKFESLEEDIASKQGSIRIELFKYNKNKSRAFKPEYETRWTFKFSVTLEWDRIISIRPDPCHILQSLFECEETKDVTVVAYGGEKLKCHRLVLAASSPVFAVMLNSRTETVESQTGQIEMRRVSGSVLKLLIQFIYGKEIPLSKINSTRAVALFKLAHRWKLAELERDLGQMMLQKKGTWFRAHALVELYHFVNRLEEFVQLRDRALKLMTKMTPQIRSCSRYKALRRTVSKDLLWRLLEKKD